MGINTIEEAEPYLKKNIFPELEQGRPNWDKPHTEAVVFYTKEIIKNTLDLNLDRAVLVVVAYAHDWGYANLFKKGIYIGREDIQNVKIMHAQISMEKISALLQDPIFSFLSAGQKERICHLVLVHDNLEKLNQKDELVFMEADTLGQLDITRATPTFNKKDNEKYMTKTLKTRISRFVTPFAKKKAEELFWLRKEHYKNKNFTNLT
ncbi:MAG: hypothetical protein AAB432_00655 [Patescibacteria group bacterium]